MKTKTIALTLFFLTTTLASTQAAIVSNDPSAWIGAKIVFHPNAEYPKLLIRCAPETWLMKTLYFIQGVVKKNDHPEKTRCAFSIDHERFVQISKELAVTTDGNRIDQLNQEKEDFASSVRSLVTQDDMNLYISRVSRGQTVYLKFNTDDPAVTGTIQCIWSNQEAPKPILGKEIFALFGPYFQGTTVGP